MESIIQWNCNGCISHLNELQLIKNEFKPFGIILQETHFKVNSNFNLRGFNIFRKDYNPIQRASGGVAIMLRSSIPATQVNLTTNIQAVAVTIETPLKTTLCNVYLPDSHWTYQQIRDLTDQLPQPFLIMGDFNSHSPTWGSELLDTRGRRIERLLDEKNICVLNSGNATYFNARSNTFSRIDLSLCSPCLVPKLTWQTLNDLHSSDHFPIIMTLDTHLKEVNFKERWLTENADWETYQKAVNIPNLPNDIEQIPNVLTESILNAAHQSIPISKGFQKKHVPWWNNDIRVVIQERKRALKVLRREPSQENLINFKKARAKARRLINESKQKSWQKYVESLTPETGTAEIWKRIKSICGRGKLHVPEILHLNDTTGTDLKNIVEIFANYYESVSSNQNYAAEFQNKKIREERNNLQFNSSGEEEYNLPFTADELENSLESCSESAPGPDNIPYSMIRHMPTHTKFKLLHAYNRIWQTGIFPQAWKIAVIIPILKEGKQCQIPSSYRPISLTCCLSKILEKMVSIRLMWYLEVNDLLSENQVGCRRKRSAVDGLIRLENDIRETFANQEHAVAVMFDLEKAYDMTWRYAILKQLHQWGLRGNLPNLLGSFLSQRFFKVRVANEESSIRLLENGIPQGSVLSVTLFAVAINNILENIPANIGRLLYVDDLTLYLQGKDLNNLTTTLQTEIDQINDRAKSCGFSFSQTKSNTIHFCRLRSEHNEPTLYLENRPISNKNTVKLLGMIFDKKLYWGDHIDYIYTKCQKKLNIMRCLAGIKWGANRETLLIMYTTLIRPIIDYASVVYGSARPTKLKKLDTIQNAALRLATGAFRTSATAALEADTSIMPLNLRREMQNMSYFCKLASLPKHLNNDLVNKDNEFSQRPSTAKPARSRFVNNADKFQIGCDNILRDISTISPWTIKKPCINLSLSRWKKELTPPSTYRNLLSEEMMKYEGWHTIYTDGSKVENGVGASFVHNNETYMWSLDINCSVYTAEVYAIWQALLFISFSPLKKCLICTDSLSALTSINKTLTNSYLPKQILELLTHLTLIGTNVHLLWIPSHMGILGNEEADSAAKIAANLNTHDGVWIPLDDKIKEIKHKIYAEWQSRWNNYEGDLKTWKTKTTKWTYPSIMNRREQVILCRLRIGHTHLTHSHLLIGADRPRCTCNRRLTIDHVFTCQQYANIRRVLFPEGEIPLGEHNENTRALEYIKRINMFKNI